MKTRINYKNIEVYTIKNSSYYNKIKPDSFKDIKNKLNKLNILITYTDKEIYNLKKEYKNV
jgi:hypothetical protein